MARRRAISPVIATVIIVAVTIAVAIAVAFWMTGIIGLFTGFEQLQITSIIDRNAPQNNRGIFVTVRNTGTSTATIIDVYINGRPCFTGLPAPACTVTGQRQGGTPVQLGGPNNPVPIAPGETVNLVIQITNPGNFGANIGPGVSLEVKLLTASGKEYPKLIVLQEYTPP
ncbi:MAG: archaellin/type IV pilin N-terminal domain-containing protein [Thermofilaceae archaeon]